MSSQTGRQRTDGWENPARMSDTELARQACSSGPAFSELYRRYFNRVYGYHFLRTGNIDDAEDLTSQTFIAALEGIQRFDGRGTFAAWLMSIAHNQMAMHYRGRRPEASLDLVENAPHPALPPEDHAHQRGLLRRVSKALRVMTPDRAEAFALRVFGGLSAAEAAGLLGKSEAAVKMLVYRALQELRQKLEVEYVVEER